MLSSNARFTVMHPCPYCKQKAKLLSYHCPVQNIILFKGICHQECNPKAVTFAVKHKECAVELWNAAFENIQRKTKGD